MSLTSGLITKIEEWFSSIQMRGFHGDVPCGKVKFEKEDLRKAAFNACLRQKNIYRCHRVGSCYLVQAVAGPEKYNGKLFSVTKPRPLMWPVDPKSKTKGEHMNNLNSLT